MEEETDPPQTELVREVTNILDTLQVLNNHLRKAESIYKKLSINKGKLEYDLSVKQNSIQIDSNLLLNREVIHLIPQIDFHQPSFRFIQSSCKDPGRKFY